MPTFVAEIQSVGDPADFRRRIAERIETVGDAVAVLEDWTESSRETRTELASKYDTAKSLARDEVAEDGDGEDDAADLPAEDLLTHPAVSDGTKRRLREYSTKLYVFLDEERSYEGAREELLTALDAELGLYRRLLEAVGADETVRDGQAAIARFARETAPGSPTQTATELLLESAVDDRPD
ncbi:hypothetical protein [Halorussus marinus]|uniref:hypothetical protein n=1 Tax=Halorussus marinus TaxID=2505976 RepID=UPI00106EA48C|nr:hypothetical protein [Halorussus marinus]